MSKNVIISNSTNHEIRIDKNVHVPEMAMHKLQQNASYAVQYSRGLLKILGVWQSVVPGKFKWRLILTNVSVIGCYFGLGMSVIPVGLFIIVEMKDPIGKIQLTGPWSFCLMAALKYSFLRSYRREIQKCMKHIEVDWLSVKTLSNCKIMLDYAKYGRLVTTFCASLTYSGGIFFAILPFVIGSFAPVNDNLNITVPRALSLPSSFAFFDPTVTPVYEILYTIQVASTFMMHSIAIACYSLAVVIVMHTCGQLKILMGQLNQLIDKDDKSVDYSSMNSRKRNIIRHHVRALKFVSKSETMLRGICLVDIGGCTLNLCFLGYFILLEWTVKNRDPIVLITFLILFMSFMFNAFSFCYIGDILTEECAKIGETIYMLDWYRLPGKQPLELGLIIAMARRPVTLTAGGMIELSFRCFASIVKTSMGYLNMLRAVMI